MAIVVYVKLQWRHNCRLLEIDEIDQFDTFGGSRILALVIKEMICLIFVYATSGVEISPFE